MDIMGEIGTLYENSPLIRDGGVQQFIYVLSGINNRRRDKPTKNIIAERGLGMPQLKVERELNMYFKLSEDQMFFQDSIKKYLEEQLQ